MQHFLTPVDEAATTLWEGLFFLTQQLKGRVLDAGCGNGDYTLRLREIPGITEIISVDIVPSDTLFWGKKFCENVGGGNYVQADIQDLSMFDSNEFDSILAWQVLEHCKEPSKALQEFARILKKDGSIFIAMPVAARSNIEKYNEKFRGTSQEHYVNWNPEDLEQKMRKVGFEPITVVYIDWQGSQNRLFKVV